MRLFSQIFSNKFLRHSFIVLNRAVATDLNQPSTWNDDALLIDLWYKIVKTKLELEEPRFFQEYPFINLSDALSNERMRFLSIRPSM